MPADSGRPADQVDWDALARFFAGESSAAEAEAASRWLAEHPEEAEKFASLNGVTARMAEPPASGEVDVDAAWMRMAAKLDEPVIAVPAGRPVERPAPATKVYGFAPRRSVWRSPALRVAAAIALIAGGAAVWQSISKPGVLVDIAGQTYNTAPGQSDSVVLSDGTRVLLGPGSWLLIQDGYGDRRRDVRLTGEALFDVRHDDARPFVVHTSEALIHDLGTTFTVRTMNGTNGTTTVAVTQGAVRVARVTERIDSGVVLQAGDRGSITPGVAFAIERGTTLDDDLAFTRGQLVFRDTPLPAVASALRRWYGVQVQVADSSINTRTLTASFNKEPLPDVLRVIALALDTPVSQQDSTVTIGRRDPP